MAQRLTVLVRGEGGGEWVACTVAVMDGHDPTEGAMLLVTDPDAVVLERRDVREGKVLPTAGGLRLVHHVIRALTAALVVLLSVLMVSTTPAHGWRSYTTTPRHAAPRRSFQRAHPCPSTGKRSGACPGYTVDHIRPLKRGGADAPYNMQWMPRDAAKQKDKWE